MKKLAILLSTLLMLVLPTVLCGAAPRQNVASFFAVKDLPGFFLHSSIALDTLNFPSTTQEYFETWMTIPKKDFDLMIRRGGTSKRLPYQAIFVHRYVFATSNQARHYVEIGWSPNKKKNPLDPSRWKPNSPSGRRIGDKSWYASYELHRNPSSSNLASAKMINDDSLRMLVIINNTVITFEAEGTDDRPVDRTWAERTILNATTKICHHHREERDTDND